MADLDIEKFREDTERFNELSVRIGQASGEDEIHELMISAYDRLEIKMPWQGDFDSFMGNRSNRLVFE